MDRAKRGNAPLESPPLWVREEWEPAERSSDALHWCDVPERGQLPPWVLSRLVEMAWRARGLSPRRTEIPRLTSRSTGTLGDERTASRDAELTRCPVIELEEEPERRYFDPSENVWIEADRLQGVWPPLPGDRPHDDEVQSQESQDPDLTAETAHGFADLHEESPQQLIHGWHSIARSDPRVRDIQPPCNPLEEDGWEERPASELWPRAAATDSEPLVREVLQKLFDRRDLFAIQFLDGDRLAAVLLGERTTDELENDPRGVIHIGVVHPDYRGDRVAALLCEHAMEEFQDMGCKTVWAELMLGNDAARRAWTQAGMEELYVVHRRVLRDET